jgi:phage terminase Nu1 subunit (DNA packaging protein)
MTDSAPAEPCGALVNRVQMAAILGIAKTTLDEWVRRGCPVHRHARCKGAAAQFDIAKVIRWRLGDAMRRAWAPADPHSRPQPLA